MRSGNSLRMQSRIAVEAVIGSSPRSWPVIGTTAAIGSSEKRMIRNPIIAFQNPATIHGKVIAKNTSSTISMTPMPPGDSARAASTKDPAIVAANKTQNSIRRPVMELPARAICVGCDGRRFNTRLRLLIPGGPCKFGNITRETAQ